MKGMLRKASIWGIRNLVGTSDSRSSWITSLSMRLASGLPAQSQQLVGGFAGTEISFGLAASGELDLYNVRVITGRRRGAETTDSVWIQLIGSNCTTSRIPLPATDGFERGSVKEFTIPVPKNLGPVKRLHVEKSQPEEFDRGGGWYLRQIEVESPDGERLLFPCNSWIGDSDCGSIKGDDKMMQQCMYRLKHPYDV